MYSLFSQEKWFKSFDRTNILYKRYNPEIGKFFLRDVELHKKLSPTLQVIIKQIILALQSNRAKVVRHSLGSAKWNSYLKPTQTEIVYYSPFTCDPNSNVFNMAGKFTSIISIVSFAINTIYLRYFIWNYLNLFEVYLNENVVPWCRLLYFV